MAVLLAALVALLQGATLERLTLDEMIAKSTDIVRGRISGSQAARHGALIYTHYSIQVLERWKGSEGATMDIVVPGGGAGRIRQTFSGAPKLATGSEYVLFLWTGPSGLTHVIGLSQGVFDLEEAGGTLTAKRAASTEAMLDGGREVRDEPVEIRLPELRKRIAAVGARGAER